MERLAIPHQPPLVFATDRASYRKDAQAWKERTKKICDEMVASVNPESATWTNTILPILEAENRASTLVSLPRNIIGRDESDESKESDKSEKGEEEPKLYERTDVFLLVDAFMQSQFSTIPAFATWPNNLPLGDFIPIDTESRHCLQKLHLKFTRNGCGITDPAEKARYVKLQKRCEEVEKEFNQPCEEDEHKGFWLTFPQLMGTHESFFSKLESGKGKHEGQFWVTASKSNCDEMVSFAHLASTRKKGYYARQNMMSSKLPLIEELILLRDDLARLLGYASHAALITANRMVKTPENVETLFSEIRAQLLPRWRDMCKELLQLKKDSCARARGETEPDKFFFWDLEYYEQELGTLKTPEIIINESQICEYFDLRTTLAKIIQFYEKLFGFRFVHVTSEQQIELGKGDPLVWHDDVLMYTVWGRDGIENIFIGYAYYDLYQRKGKMQGDYTTVFQKTWIKPDGTRFCSSSAVIMDFPESKYGITLDGIRNLFHETGHLVHCLCTETKYADSHQTAHDFTESPALMMELFLRQPQVIKELSCHYSYLSSAEKKDWCEKWGPWEASHPKMLEDNVSKQLPDDIIAVLLKNDLDVESFRKQLDSLFFATFDMRLHNPKSRADLHNINITELYNRTESEIYGIYGGAAVGDGWQYAHGQTSAGLTHVISEYDAGYYSYLLGSVHAHDMFKSGFEGRLTSEKAIEEAGAKYRNMVFRVGGSQPEAKTLTEYLGRSPNTKAYFASLGIDTAARSSTKRSRADLESHRER